MKKKWLVLFMAALFNVGIVAAQTGKFAGSMKKLIGTKFTGNNLDKKLKGFTYKGGTVLSFSEVSLILYQKGTTQLVVLAEKYDNSEESMVRDIIEEKNIPKGWELYVSVCRENKNPNVEIVALVKITPTTYFKQVKKAWRANRDKFKFETKNKKGIDCLNEGQD
jgi:hypothetical protein